ncbi:helix-turn-helix domain-containing protein [Neorhizobium lilium]|uniref:Helix-turn-helix domain-containing protein n=1 Tax=Neorhizobium lilium TaxID=2503024 RepID=A0A444LBC9_9HYPH|nr:helix-turn-helix domain-containing protein [Neorhizobium lilium]RWX74982.1 helix-turn-helix domain-containing protein [Neorhizobium lilium]
MSTPGQPRCIPVFVVVPPRALLLDIAGPVEVLRRANLEQSAVRFDISYVGPAPEVHSSVGLALAGIAPLPTALPQCGFVIVSGAVDEPLPAGSLPGDPLLARPFSRSADEDLERQIVGWLSDTIRPGTTLLTICSGALLAARAGLLEGYECTTHHTMLPDLVRLAPTAKVRDNRLFVEDGERLTSAGVTTGIDLMLSVVAREAGHPAALAAARTLVIYLRRAGGDPQLSPWLQGRSHLHQALHRVQDAIGAEPARDWSVERLASIATTSPRNLSRLFNEHVGMSVTDYVNRTRIALARELVTGSRLDMEMVAERAGFSSARQFRRVWNRLNEMPPVKMRDSSRQL